MNYLRKELGIKLLKRIQKFPPIEGLSWLRNFFLIFCILLLSFCSKYPAYGASLIYNPTGKNCNFENLSIVRPGLDAPPTQVSIGIYLLDIIRLNDIKKSYDARFMMKLRWKDSRLAEQLQSQKISSCHVDIDMIWNPDAYVYNQRRLKPEYDNVASISSDGTVRYRQIFDAELGSSLDFKKFPFDSQTLSLKIVSLENNSDQVNFVKMAQQPRISNSLSFVGWTLDMTTKRAETGFEQLNIMDDTSVPFFEVDIDVRRDSSYSIWKLLFPLLIIVSASYLVFWLEPTLIIPQIALSSSTLFSFVAYQASIYSNRPRVSYLTSEDYFLIGSIVLIVSALVETIFTYNLAKCESKVEIASQIDHVFRWSYPIALVSIVIFAFA